MGVKYNPFAGNLDIVDSPSGDFSDIEISGDLTLGTGTPVTTVQAVTPTANRTISFPDQTGTVALVAGATGAIQYNESGAQTGTVDFAVDPDWNNASTTFTGLKLNVTDTASAADSKLVDIQSNGVSKFVVEDDGRTGINTTNPSAPGLTVVGPGGGNGELDVSRTSGATVQLQAQSALGRVGTTSNHNLQLMANGTGVLNVTTAGNVGIGAATFNNNPKLGVAGSVNIGGLGVTIGAAATSTVITPARGYSYINVSTGASSDLGLLLLVFANTNYLSIINTINDRTSANYSASVSGRDLQITNNTAGTNVYYASCVSLLHATIG